MSTESNKALGDSLASISVTNPSSPTGYIQTMDEWFTRFAAKTSTDTGGLVPYTFGAGIVNFPQKGEISFVPNPAYGTADPDTGVVNNVRYSASFWNGFEWQGLIGGGTVTTAVVPRSTNEDDVDPEANISLYREITGGAFPTLYAWYQDATKTVKLKEIIITRDGSQKPITIVYKFYLSGVLSQTWTDTITYSGAFEVSRTRSIT